MRFILLFFSNRFLFILNGTFSTLNIHIMHVAITNFSKFDSFIKANVRKHFHTLLKMVIFGKILKMV